MLSAAFWRVLARHGCLCVHSLYDVQQLQHPHSHSLMPGYFEHPSIASLQSLYQRVILSICFFAVVVPMFRSPCMTAYLHWYIPWHGTVKRDVFFFKVGSYKDPIVYAHALHVVQTFKPFHACLCDFHCCLPQVPHCSWQTVYTKCKLFIFIKICLDSYLYQSKLQSYLLWMQTACMVSQHMQPCDLHNKSDAVVMHTCDSFTAACFSYHITTNV